VARSPLDVAVSCFYNSCSLRLHSYQNDFRTYWNYFINDMGKFGLILKVVSTNLDDFSCLYTLLGAC